MRKKQRKLGLLLALSTVMLTACVPSGLVDHQTDTPGAFSSSGAVGEPADLPESTDEKTTEAVTEEVEPTENAVAPTESITGTENAPEKLRADSPEMEYMLNHLWGLTLQRVESTAPYERDEERWNRSYKAEAYLEDFTLDTFAYGVRTVYPGKDFESFIYYWPDYIQDVKKSYLEAESKLQPIYDGVMSYDEAVKMGYLTKAREESILQVEGEIANQLYPNADLFTEGMNSSCYVLWGSVLKVAGQLHQENIGTILGRFSGHAVMMDFDFETLTGTFWICLDGQAPVQVSMRFHNGDCAKYFLDINRDAVFQESELEQGWLGIEFDLFTTQTGAE